MIEHVDFKKIGTNSIKLLVECIRLGKPILISNIDATKEACSKWTPEYISSLNPSLPIPVKQYSNGMSIDIKNLTLDEYLNYLITYRKNKDDLSSDEILYCHDIPIFSLINKLIEDIEPSFLAFLPQWYHREWWSYIQFFMGPRGSWTPLHFDCLMTNNIFFQVKGRKRFTLINPQDGKYCGRYSWRWYKLDPEKPDARKFPNINKVNMENVIVNSGDMLYIPPGMLHAVRSLDESISFNMDFHTPRSALVGMSKVFQGMPIKNVYYNFICSLGLILKIPSKYLFPLYKSYLNYVS